MMRELSGEQLKEISGGVIFYPSDSNTHTLVLSPNESFFFVNFETADTFMFGDRGNVLYVNPLKETSHRIYFPFNITNDQLCEYSVSSSFFKLGA